jgi:excisionase family DNA binding protein
MAHKDASIETLTLAEVAAELGVHYMTAYRYVRLGLLDGHQVGRSWQISRSDLNAFTSDSSVRRPSGRGKADWQGRLRARLVAGDEPGAWNAVEAALASGMTVPDVYVFMLVPALKEIGELWHAGTIDVSDEHTASRVASRIISRLGARVRTRGVKRGTVVLGSTATELHSIPVAIAADLLRSAHFNVLDLGDNLPAASFATAVKQADSVVAIAVSVTTTGQEDELSSTLAAIRSVSDRPLIVGGRGIDSATAIRLGADRYAATGPDAVVILEEILGD